MIYIIYLILEFRSTSFRIILSISNNDIYEKIKNIIHGKPVISFNSIFYHKERSKGEEVDVITFKDSFKFPYYTVRDCSGIIFLNSYTKNIKYKFLLKLNINNKIYFADNGTKSDYSNIETIFIRRNINKDKLFKSDIIIDFEGVNTYNIISLNVKTSYFINVFLYDLFSLLTLIEFYKLFIKIVTLDQEITIIKFISTRKDLSKIQEYNTFNPELFVPHDNKHIHYESNIYNNISNNKLIRNPRINEIQGANNNVEPNEINNINNYNNNINNVHNYNNINNDNNSNILGINPRQNNQANFMVIHVDDGKDGEDKKSTEVCSSKSEINN